MALTAFRMAQFANMTATLAAHDDAAEITVVHRLLASDAKPSRVGTLAESTHDGSRTRHRLAGIVVVVRDVHRQRNFWRTFRRSRTKQHISNKPRPVSISPMMARFVVPLTKAEHREKMALEAAQSKLAEEKKAAERASIERRLALAVLEQPASGAASDDDDEPPHQRARGQTYVGVPADVK